MYVHMYIFICFSHVYVPLKYYKCKIAVSTGSCYRISKRKHEFIDAYGIGELNCYDYLLF